MVGGSWLNQDGLPLQFGTQKAVPEISGEFMSLGESRVLEFLINLGPAGVPQSINGTTTVNAATPAIVSLTTLLPLVTSTSTTYVAGLGIPGNQTIFIEQVEVDTLTGMSVLSGATGISVGLTAITGTGINTAFTAVTPNAGVQLLNALPNAAFTTAGQKVTFNIPGSSGIEGGTGATVAGGGAWMGPMPLCTLAAPIPSNAYVSIQSAGGAGTYTAGLLKLRVKYNQFGTIPY